MGRTLHLALTALLAVACGYLVYSNATLRDQLESADAPEVKEQVEQADADAAVPASRSRPSLLAQLGKNRNRERPEIKVPDKETRAERRQRRTQEMRDLLGREPGESEEDYIDRMRPMVVAGLAKPRVATQEARRAAEEAAGVSDEQRAAIDEILADTYDETMQLANQAIQSGDVSPYRRNWAGSLQVAGGIGSVLQSTEQRIGDVLSPEQQQILYDSGFEWGEYVGANTPWEDLRPPPLPEN